MDIINTLEDLDSRIDKAKSNFARWFVLVAVIALGSVAASYAFRAFSEGRKTRTWSSFDYHLGAKYGLANSPVLWVKTDEELAGEQLRERGHAVWADVAAVSQLAGKQEFEKAAAAAARLGIETKGDAVGSGVFAMVKSGATGDPARDLEDRINRLRTWIDSRPSLSENRAGPDSTGLEIETDAGKQVIRWDPKLPPELLAELQATLSGDALANGKFVWNGSARTFDLAPPAEGDAAARVSRVLENVTPDVPSFSLFAGAVVAKASASESSKRTLGIVPADYRGREFELIPVGQVVEGAAFLLASPGTEPEKKEITVQSVK